MKQIIKLIEAIQAGEKELAELKTLEAKVSADILALAEIPATSPAFQQRLADASIAKQLLTARRAKVSVPLSQQYRELMTRLQEGVEVWNKSCKEAIASLRKDFTAKLASFFNGDKSELTAFVDQGNFDRLPAVVALYGITYELPATVVRGGRRDAQLDLVAHFLRHVSSYAGRIAFNPDTID